jgi:hypothetical protein
LSLYLYIRKNRQFVTRIENTFSKPLDTLAADILRGEEISGAYGAVTVFVVKLSDFDPQCISPGE